MANADEVKTNANDATATEAEVTKELKETKAEVTKKPKETEAEETKEPKETTEETKKASIALTKDLQAKIIRQVEYYFGDINLPKDKFLQEQIALDDGWVPFSVLLTFKRLFSICPEEDVIAQALINGENDLVMVSDDRKKVRRNPELIVPEYNDERRKELMSRTAYVKGFAVDDTLESIMKFFEGYGPYESVIMRSYTDKAVKKQVFKGSIFIIFKTVDECKAFLDKEEVKYNDGVLIKRWQADYLEDKKKEREERNEKRKGHKKDSQDKKETPKHSFAKGAILHMTGFKDSTVRETIKKEVTAIFEKDPAFVTFDKGDTEGYLRFSEANEAVDFLAKLTDSKFKVDEAEITCRVLEGEEEETFLQDLSQQISRLKSHNKFSHKNKGRKRRSGGGGDGPRPKRERK